MFNLVHPTCQAAVDEVRVTFAGFELVRRFESFDRGRIRLHAGDDELLIGVDHEVEEAGIDVHGLAIPVEAAFAGGACFGAPLLAHGLDRPLDLIASDEVLNISSQWL